MVQEVAADGIPIAVACRVLEVSTSGYYEWKSRPKSVRETADAELVETIQRIHSDSRGSYGAPRIHAELKLGLGVRCGRKRVARLMRQAQLVGICHKRKRRHHPQPATQADLVKRKFTASEPDRLWCTDITEHPTKTGKVYCCAVMDVYSRSIVGWAIADHMRTELVTDALDMARWRRKPAPGTIVHADRGSQYTSWVFGNRLRSAGLLGSMGRVASSVDNTMIESFWSTMQRELLDQHQWESQTQLTSAIFEWIEAWYNPTRRHTSLENLSPHEYELTHNTNQKAA